MNVLFDFIILMQTDLNWFLTANGFLGKDSLFTADTLPVFGIDEKTERLKMVEIARQQIAVIMTLIQNLD